MKPCVKGGEEIICILLAAACIAPTISGLSLKACSRFDWSSARLMLSNLYVCGDLLVENKCSLK